MTELASAYPAPLKGTWSAVPDSISEIRTAHLRFAVDAGASRRTADAVALAVSEAAANAIIHAFGDGIPAGRVTATAELLAYDRLRCVVSDDGRGMAHERESSGLGLGLALIAQMAERVEIHSEPGAGTELCMDFRLP
jgi:anti-sigma regulatory factor (Ser/Thr protein kinase)